MLLIDADQQASASSILLGTNIANDPIISMKNISSLSREYREEESKSFKIDDLFGNATEIEKSRSKYTGLHDLIWEVLQGNPVTKKILQNAIVTPTYKGTRNISKTEKISLEEFNKMKVENIPYGFDLLPASEELTDDELFLGSTEKELPVSKISIFKVIVDAIKKNLDYDIIIFDCAPSLGVFSLNAIFAADGSVLVGQPDIQSIFSMALSKKNFRDLKLIDVTQKGILGFVLNACPTRNIVRPILEHEIKETLGINFYNTVIPYSSKAAQANTTGRIFCEVDKRAGEVYKELAAEILQSYYDNEAWEEYRTRKYNEAKTKFIEDNHIKELLDKRAYEETKEMLNEKGKDIEDVKRESIDSYNKLIDYNFEKVLRDYIVEEYEKGNLWKGRTSNFHKNLEGEEYE